MSATPAYYPTLIVSDAHLGIPQTNGSGAMLAEFLRNVRCDTLILNGDIIDGSRRDERHVHRFPRAQKPVFDLLNQKIAEGTKVYYLPGNHDTKLRDLGLFGQEVFGMKLEPWLDLTDPHGRRLHVAHGDRYNGEKKPKAAKPSRRSLRGIFHDRAYTATVRISGRIDRLTARLLHRHFGLAARLHGREATRKHWRENREAESLDRARQGGFDGVIFGHFHLPAKTTAADGTTYLNSGDWVENFTAIALDTAGEWQLLRWPDLREKMRQEGTFTAKPTAAERQQRPQTEKLLAAARQFWPGRCR